jgi:hypothetical protein
MYPERKMPKLPLDCACQSDNIGHSDWNLPITLKRSSQMGKETCEELLKNFGGGD